MFVFLFYILVVCLGVLGEDKDLGQVVGDMGSNNSSRVQVNNVFFVFFLGVLVKEEQISLQNLLFIFFFLKKMFVLVEYVIKGKKFGYVQIQ